MSTFRPVFVIGAARSGTKLLRDLIAGHPAVERVPYDVNYIWRLGHESLNHDELLAQDLTPHQAERIRKQIAKYHSDSPLLVEKTVSNCLRVPYVKTVFPEGRLIHLVRDGRDVVESTYRQWSAPPDWRYITRKALSYPLLDAFGYASSYAWSIFRKQISRDKSSSGTWGPRYRGIEQDLSDKSVLEVCAIQWSRCVQAATEDLARLPADEQLTVVYEEFVDDPETNMARIANFLALDSVPFAAVLDGTTVSRENVGKGGRTLDRQQLDVIMPYIEDSLQMLNYA